MNDNSTKAPDSAHSSDTTNAQGSTGQHVSVDTSDPAYLARVQAAYLLAEEQRARELEETLKFERLRAYGLR